MACSEPDDECTDAREAKAWLVYNREHFSTMANEVDREQHCISRPLPHAIPVLLEGGRLWISHSPGRAIALIRLEKMAISQKDGE